MCSDSSPLQLLIQCTHLCSKKGKQNSVGILEYNIPVVIYCKVVKNTMAIPICFQFCQNSPLDQVSMSVLADMFMCVYVLWYILPSTVLWWLCAFLSLLVTHHTNTPYPRNTRKHGIVMEGRIRARVS